MSEPAPSSGSQLPVAIIGAGPTGSAAAYHLHRAGRRVRLFEGAGRLGGSVKTVRDDGWLIEAGPDSFQENSSEIVQLLKELGLEGQRLEASPAAKNRFIVRDGKLVAVPLSPPALLSTPLFSGRTKLRLLSDVFRQPRRRSQDVSVAEFVADHFGTEIVEYAVNPFVSGIYAGDARRLSARHAFPKLWEGEQEQGSLIRSQIAQAKARRAAGHPKTKIISFRNGLQTLVDALGSTLPQSAVETGVKIESLLPGKAWRLVWSRSGEARTESFSHVLLAVPAASLAELTFGALAERPLAALEAVEYPPVTSHFLGFRQDQVSRPLNGFGALVPTVERLPFLGVLFSSSLFPDRAPAGHVALAVMVGGTQRRELAALSLEEWRRTVLPPLGQLLGIRGEPVYHQQHAWPRAIAQYNLGHERFLEVMTATEQAYPGLHIGGNVRDGISLPNCLQSGMSMAKRVLDPGA